jgi:hypothetical protein
VTQGLLVKVKMGKGTWVTHGLLYSAAQAQAPAPQCGNSVRLPLPHKFFGRNTRARAQLNRTIAFVYLRCLIVSRYLRIIHFCVSWETPVRSVAQHDSALCLGWTPARRCQKPGLEGTYPSWPNSSEMWHKRAAMTGEVCVVCAFHGCQRARPQTQTRCGHCTTA